VPRGDAADVPQLGTRGDHLEPGIGARRPQMFRHEIARTPATWGRLAGPHPEPITAACRRARRPLHRQQLGERGDHLVQLTSSRASAPVAADIFGTKSRARFGNDS
jgi:hypothetical protein